jgi:hypothetical protein
MGTNFYKIPTHEEMVMRKHILLGQINGLDLSPLNIECGFRVTVDDQWNSESPWDTFINGTNIHLGKRSGGWKFLWNFHKNKYYSNKEELFSFIRSGRVIDEYGKEWDVEEFITMALDWEQPNGLILNEEYRKRERTKGHGMLWLDNEKYDDLIIDGLRVCQSTDFS